MLTETRQISSLRSQDLSNEIPSDLVRRNVVQFSDKFFHFQYLTLEMFEGALNNYSILKLLFNQHPPICSLLQKRLPSGHQTTYFIAELPQNRGRTMSIFFVCHSFFYYAAFFPSKEKLKFIIIHFPFEISNDIIQWWQCSRGILHLLPPITPNVD